LARAKLREGEESEREIWRERRRRRKREREREREGERGREKETNGPKKAKKSSSTEPGRETRVRWWRARGGAPAERGAHIVLIGNPDSRGVS